MSSRIGWFDGGAGASGDMTLGALVSAGVPLAVVQAEIDRLDLGIELTTESVQRAGLGATKMRVHVPETRTVRHLPEIVEMFTALTPEVASRAGEVFERLAHAEAAVHDMSVEKVHFHEVGALDSIADVVGSVAGLVHLNLDALWCSTLSLGSGSTRGAHGPIPVPAPAVLELLKGLTAAQAGPASYESTTPTGAAIMATMVQQWGPMPAMTIDQVGMGAGTKDTAEVANVLRLVIGESAEV